MKITFTSGQFYEHASGELYEVVNATKRGVSFETTEGAVVYMDVDDVVEDIKTGVLTLQEDDDEDEEDGGDD